MKRFLFALALLEIMAFSPSLAVADHTYDVSFSDPNMGGSGDVSVAGTITVDTLGTLAAADITGYSLTISSPDAPSTLLDPANSAIVLFGSAVLTADALALTVSLPAQSGPASLFEFSSDIANAGFGFQGGGGMTYGTPPQRFIENLPDQSIVTLSSSPGTFLVGTAASAVPEPSSLVMAGIGIASAMGYRLRRRASAAV